MGYNSNYIRATVKTFQCRGRQNLSEGTCQKSCESNQNCGISGQKDPTYFKEALLQVSPLVLLKHVVLIIRIINIIIKMGGIRQERSNK